MTLRVIRKRLSEREGAPPDTRYDPDTDTVETSVDGGLTWTPNPGADPRINPAYLLPPNTEPDVRCAAAAGMVTYIRQVVDFGIDGTTIAGLGNLLLAGILIFLPVSWFFALMALAAEALIAIGGAALAFSFSEDVYDQLLCILYDHADADGRLDAAALAAAQSDVDAQIADVTVSAVFELVVQMAGHVGVSNAGAAHADGEAECDCVVLCHEIDFTLTNGAASGVEGLFSSAYTGGVGWTGTDAGGGVDVTILWTFPEQIFVTEWTIHYTKPSGAGNSSDVNNCRALRPIVNYANDLISLDDENILGTDLIKNMVVGDNVDGLSVDINTGNSGGSSIISLIRVFYTHEAPIWDENCTE